MERDFDVKAFKKTVYTKQREDYEAAQKELKRFQFWAVDAGVKAILADMSRTLALSGTVHIKIPACELFTTQIVDVRNFIQARLIAMGFEMDPHNYGWCVTINERWWWHDTLVIRYSVK